MSTMTHMATPLPAARHSWNWGAPVLIAVLLLGLLSVWLGQPYRQRRGFGAPGTAGPQVLHSEPYLDPDMFLFDGNNNQTVHISPRQRLIVLRMGATPPVSPEWDNSYLPNLLIRGLTPGH